jgi:RimJ/RimL family protein N-acetyltransferase
VEPSISSNRETDGVSSMSSRTLRARHVLAGEQARLRKIRLASLAANPEAFGSTYARDSAQDPEWWERWAAQSADGTMQRTFVLVNDDEDWLGLTLVRLDDEQPGPAALTAMWVSPEARGRRAATSLCDACAVWATELGARKLTLTVVVGNQAGRRAYEAAGFAISGEKTWSREDRTLDVLVMSRPL